MPMPWLVRLLVTLPVLVLLGLLAYLLAFMAAWSSDPLAALGLVVLVAAVCGLATGFITWVLVGLQRPPLLLVGAGAGVAAALLLGLSVTIRAS